MALFKIFKGNSNKLGSAPTSGQQDTRFAHEGFAYFTPDDGKFYIDIAGNAGDNNTDAVSTYGASNRNRIPISAEKADRDNNGNIITQTYAADIGVDSTDNKIKLYNKTGSAIANAELNTLEVSTMNLGDILPPQDNTTNGQFLQSNGTSANWATVITTDELVKQTVKSDNVNYKLLATASASPTSGNATETIYDTNVTLNPSTSTITASHFIGDLTGNASSASSVAWSNITNKPDSYYTLPTAADNTLGGIKTNYSASGKNYAVKVDNSGNAYVNVPWTDNNTTSFTITANATDGLWDLTGTNGTNTVTYALAPYSTKQSSAAFYTGTTNPTLTTRLNYDGYLYATRLYSDGSQVLTGITAISSGTGNVVTAISASNGTITYTLGEASTVAAQIIRW